MQIKIANPRCGGAKYTSARRASEFVARGIARWLPDESIEFVEEIRLAHLTSEMRQSLWEENHEFLKNRGGVLFWNGARAVYKSGQDLAMFPPGCNVSFPKVGTKRAAMRYC
jgi:hypothetical protein